MKLRHGIDILTIFGDKRDRFPDFLDYMFKLCISEWKMGDGKVPPGIIYDKNRHRYYVDFVWMVHAIIEWLSDRNPSASYEEIELFIRKYMLTSKEEFTSVPRFFVIGLLGEYYGVLGTQHHISLMDYKIPRGSYYYQKALFFGPTLYTSPMLERPIYQKRIQLDSYVVQNFSGLEYSIELGAIVEEMGIVEVAFGAKKVRDTLGGGTAIVAMRFPEA